MTQNASQSAWSTLPAGPAISDTNGWNQPQCYNTIQSADFDGDGQAEMLARGASGISVWQCDQNTAWISERVTGVSTLNMLQYLGVGDYLVSPSGQCVAVVQDDGNFVVYQGSAPNQTGAALWETGPAGQSSGEHIVTMQSDGNLALYQGPHPAQVNKSTWSSVWQDVTNIGSSTIGQATTTLQDTGELIIQTVSQAANTLWSSLPTTPNWTSPDWMSKLTGNKLLSQFTLPGTHDSCARKPIPYVQCQDLSLTDQLNKGIRFLDIRCRHIDNSFAIHHSEFFLDMMFGTDVQDVCISFLQAHPGECIVMSIKEEYNPSNKARSFQAIMGYNRAVTGEERSKIFGGWTPITKLIQVRPAELIVATPPGVSTRRKFVTYFAPLIGFSSEGVEIKKGERAMRVVHERCCGLDVHKKTVVACVLITPNSGEGERHLRTFSTMTVGLFALADWLESMDVSVVALESTGSDWRPVFHLIEEGRTMILVCWQGDSASERRTRCSGVLAAS